MCREKKSLALADVDEREFPLRRILRGKGVKGKAELRTGGAAAVLRNKDVQVVGCRVEDTDGKE